jgi:hypothetical protein
MSLFELQLTDVGRASDLEGHIYLCEAVFVCRPTKGLDTLCLAPVADHLDADALELVLLGKLQAVGELRHATRRVGLGRDELAKQAGRRQRGQPAEVCGE